MRKNLLKIVGILLILFLVLIISCNYYIKNATSEKTFSDIDKVPFNEVGLVLGTSNRLAKGGANPYYTYRINAAINLYKHNKISFILVSGDNETIFYNEPNTIKKDLIKGGIPADKIFLDFAGFRTLDSVMRAKLVFGLHSVTIISQQFHNERAIYLADKKGLNAIGYNAKDVDIKYGLKVRIREYFARVKVFIDLLLNTQPKFVGESIEIK